MLDHQIHPQTLLHDPLQLFSLKSNGISNKRNILHKMLSQKQNPKNNQEPRCVHGSDIPSWYVLWGGGCVVCGDRLIYKAWQADPRGQGVIQLLSAYRHEQNIEMGKVQEKIVFGDRKVWEGVYWVEVYGFDRGGVWGVCFFSWEIQWWVEMILVSECIN